MIVTGRKADSAVVSAAVSAFNESATGKWHIDLQKTKFDTSKARVWQNGKQMSISRVLGEAPKKRGPQKGEGGRPNRAKPKQRRCHLTSHNGRRAFIYLQNMHVLSSNPLDVGHAQRERLEKHTSIFSPFTAKPKHHNFFAHCPEPMIQLYCARQPTNGIKAFLLSLMFGASNQRFRGHCQTDLGTFSQRGFGTPLHAINKVLGIRLAPSNENQIWRRASDHSGCISDRKPSWE